MRAYAIPFVAGVALVVSAFLPWVVVGNLSLRGFPDTASLWWWSPRAIVALGLAAAVLATLSLITRKNSRHPILLVGLLASGIMFIEWQIAPRSFADRLRTRAQAVAIVENTPVTSTPAARPGGGIYLGFVAAILLVAFGLTIIFKRAATPYVMADPNDDVE
jgi:hypothetical protein